jgi:hypothetical protein
MWKKALGLDGEIYDSESEAKIADWFFLNDIKYTPHKHLPKPSRSISDFYLPEYDLWVEYDGLMEVRSNDKLEKKRELYQKLGLKFLIITRDDWELDLLERIELGG